MLVNNLFVSSVSLEIYFTVMCSHLTVTSVLRPAPTLSPYFWVAQAIFEPNFSRINTPTFSTPVIPHTYPPMKVEQTECSKMLAYKIKMPGNYPEESIQQVIITRIIMTWLLKLLSLWSLAVQGAFCILIETEGPLLCS
jgi:hypothetical protein